MEDEQKTLVWKWGSDIICIVRAGQPRGTLTFHVPARCSTQVLR